MPPVKEHINSSFKRTGKEYRELHEWMDSEYKRLEKHDIINLAENINIVKEKFGKDAVKEFLWHIKDDCSQPRCMIKRIIAKFL